MNKKERILIIGASGFLGTCLYNFFSKKTSFVVKGTYFNNENEIFEKLDILDYDQVLRIVKLFKPTIIIHVAGAARPTLFKNRQNNNLHELNYCGTKNIIDCANIIKAKIIFFSSLFVFNANDNNLFSELSQVCPLGLYGKSKAESEKLIKTNNKYLIIRTDLLFGYNGKKLNNGLLNLILDNNDMHFPKNEIRKPLYVDDLCSIVEALIKQKYTGILHITGNQPISYYDFVKTISLELGMSQKIKNYNSEYQSLPILDTNKFKNMKHKISSISESINKIKRKINV